MVINTLVDPLVQHCFSLGYRFSSSNMCLNLLQYADDTCLLARDPRSCQRMLNVMEKWLTWSWMRAKPSKCQAVALKSRTNADNRVYDPQLVLGSSLIPFLGNTTTNFLGMPLSPTLNTTHCWEIISTKVQGMMQKIDSAPLSSKYTLLIYRRALPAKVGWILKITHTSPSFVSDYGIRTSLAEEVKGQLSIVVLGAKVAQVVRLWTIGQRLSGLFHRTS